MDVLIAGGGTGGHLFPGIALAQEVRRRDPGSRIVFVGSKRGIERHAVPRAGFDLELLPVSGLRSQSLGSLIRGLFWLPVALLKAFVLIWRFRPEVAVSCGGYAAGPAVLAARLCGVPCFVLEQNAIPGLTNRILGRLSRRIIAALPVRGFDEGKVLVLGNPVRADLVPIREVEYSPQEPLRVLVFGGSQGARALNDVMIAAAPRWKALAGAIQITHQTGPADVDRVRAAYGEAGCDNVSVAPFIDDMATAYRNADVVLCRAGATTIAELTVCGRPAILVPFPFAVDDHQTANALKLVEVGAALHIPQAQLTADGLVEHMERFVADPSALCEMARRSHDMGKPNAVRDIADAIGEEVSDV